MMNDRVISQREVQERVERDIILECQNSQQRIQILKVHCVNLMMRKIRDQIPNYMVSDEINLWA